MARRLPILQTLGAMYFEGEMTLALKDIKVLDDMLTNLRRDEPHDSGKSTGFQVDAGMLIALPGFG